MIIGSMVSSICDRQITKIRSLPIFLDIRYYCTLFNFLIAQPVQLYLLIPFKLYIIVHSNK